jgi:chromosome partitioning protein
MAWDKAGDIAGLPNEEHVIVTVAQEKGGVGKTTTAKDLAAAAAHMGRRVLAVDVDPQWALTRQLGVDVNTDQAPFSTADVLAGRIEAADVRVAHEEGFDVLPGSRDLRGIEMALVGEVARETRLGQALADLQNDYDLVVIDTPPNLGMLTVNALVPADIVIAPVAADDEGAVQGLAELRATLAKLGPLRPGRPAPELRVIVTRWNDRLRMTSVVEDAIVGLQLRVYARIPARVAVKHASVFRRSIRAIAPDSGPAIAYHELAQQLLAEAPVK